MPDPDASAQPPGPAKKPAPPSDPSFRLARVHLLFGWCGLGLVVLSGLLLEGLHAFKVEFYLLPDQETRRFLWRLAHAHAGLLCLLHLGFATTLLVAPESRGASRPLTWASITLPAGFFLGGLGASAGDPSAGILLVPFGAICLLVSIFRVTRALVQAHTKGADY